MYKNLMLLMFIWNGKMDMHIRNGKDENLSCDGWNMHEIHFLIYVMFHRCYVYLLSINYVDSNEKNV